MTNTQRTPNTSSSRGHDELALLVSNCQNWCDLCLKNSSILTYINIHLCIIGQNLILQHQQTHLLAWSFDASPHWETFLRCFPYRCDKNQGILVVVRGHRMSRWNWEEMKETHFWSDPGGCRTTSHTTPSARWWWRWKAHPQSSGKSHISACRVLGSPQWMLELKPRKVVELFSGVWLVELVVIRLAWKGRCWLVMTQQTSAGWAEWIPGKPSPLLLAQC